MEKDMNTDVEFMGEQGLSVTGQSRMEAAYGSGDGDESLSAAVSGGNVAKSGTIYEQIYRPWRGTINPRWSRNWAIFRHHLFGIFSKGHRAWGWPTRLALFAILLGSMSDLLMSMLGGLIGADEMSRMFGPNRANLYGHVLGFAPRNAFCFPIAAALLIGGIISEDRKYGTSAIYFSRPINRFDYTAMKYISVAIILFLIIDGTLAMYYFGNIILNNEGWNYLIDTIPLFATAAIAGMLLIFTYTSIGLCLSSVSKGKFFPAVALLGIFLGSKLIAFLVWLIFERSVVYLLSPYDCVAHVAQTMMNISSSYDHPWSWSLVSVLVMNAVSLYIIASRVSSMEVTRE